MRSWWKCIHYESDDIFLLTKFIALFDTFKFSFLAFNAGKNKSWKNGNSG